MKGITFGQPGAGKPWCQLVRIIDPLEHMWVLIVVAAIEVMEAVSHVSSF